MSDETTRPGAWSRAGRCLAGLGFAGALLATGCGTGSFQNENDRLRARVMDLEDALEQETRRRQELETMLGAVPTDPGTEDPEVQASTPVLARLVIGRRSHALDADGDGAVDTVRLHVVPEDGRGRLLQVTGTLAAHVGRLPAEGDAQTLGRATLTPSALRDAYRATVFGTYYIVDVPIAVQRDVETTTECDARIVFTDGRTGRTTEAHRALRLDG